MEFCPECGAILLPMNKKLKCKCGYEKSLSDEVKEYINKQYDGGVVPVF